MPRLTRPALFGLSTSTRRTNRAATLSARTLTTLGVNATRALAGPGAAGIVGDVIKEVRRYRRGGAAKILESVAIQALGGVGQAIAWLLGGRRGPTPQATPSEVAAARNLIETAQPTSPVAEAPVPIRPGRGIDVEPTPSPSTGRGRGGRGGLGDTGRGVSAPGGDGGEGSPPGGGSGGPAGDPGQPEPGRTGIQMFRVTNSSNVHSYGYDITTATLYVRYLSANLDGSKVKFKRNDAGGLQHVSVGKGAFRGRSSKPGPMYAYFGVPNRVFRAMQGAISKGKFVWDALRVRGSIWRHQYAYKLVAAGVAHIGKDSAGRADSIMYVPRRASRKGFVRRELGVASGQTIQSNMSRTISRRRLEMRRMRQIGF